MIVITYLNERDIMKKILLLLFICFFYSNLFSGITGKITGRVIDSKTKEPIPSVNIVIEGTIYGTATNIQGYYLLNNIPPGTYTLIFSAIGYETKIIKGVKISSDFTTKLNVELSEEVIKIETIVVEAETPLIREDLTSTQSTIDAEQISTLPVENIHQILSLQAGITQGVGGELHIRGGRTSEILYTVNGVSIVNPFDNSQMVEIATNAVQEISVVSGTFNAEYGNALSGVVNTVTKEGTQEYKVHFSSYSGDFFSSRKNIFFNVDDIDPLSNSVTEFTFSGPLPLLSNKFLFFVSGRYDNNKGWLFGVREHNPWDSVFINPANPNDIQIAKSGDDAIIPMNPSKKFSGTFKLTFKPLSTVKINYDLLYSKSFYKYYSHDFKYNPDADYNYHENGLINSIDLRHALSPNTFYSFKILYNFNDYKQYLYPLIDENGNPVDYYAGKGTDGLFADPRYQPIEKLTRPVSYTFYFGGTRNGHSYERAKTFGLKFDLVSQLNLEHELKFGLEYKIHTLDYESFVIKRDTIRYLVPTIPDINSPDHDLYTKRPVQYSFYIQDKMEYANFILNVGLRYDYFHSKSKYSTNLIYPSPNDPSLPTYVDKNSILKDASPKHQLSPRLGISFPITDRGIIHFSYGHFFQMPPFQYLYANSNFKSSYAVGTPIFGDANLNPEKTVTYELGLQQLLLDDLAMTITGYYKDVRDLLALQTIRVTGDRTYLKYVNKDYGNIKGITLSLVKRRSVASPIGVTVDYTFQVAEGNDTDPDAFFLDLSSGRQSEKLPVFLAWDQTHSLNTTVTFGKVNDWSITLINRIGTGLPYTPQITGKQVYVRTNSGRRPSQFIVNMFGEKIFKLFGVNLTVFIKIFNLFDNLIERLVYDDTGRATYTLLQTSGATKSADELSKRIPLVHSPEEYFNRPHYYQAPREIRIGFELDF